MNASAARLLEKLPLPWPAALLCFLTLGLYVPAFYWLIYDHWYRFEGSLLGIIPLVLGGFWLRHLWQHSPTRANHEPFPTAALLLFTAGLWLLLAGWSAEASAIMGWSCSLVIPAMAWLYGGREGLKMAWFPALCIAMAFPVPGIIEHHLGLHARIWSAFLAQVMLSTAGMALERAGTFLTTDTGISLDVGNACSGVKTMHVFLVAALMLLQPLRQRPLRFFALLPVFFIVSVLANGVRVAALVLIAARLDPKWLEGAAHELTGLFFFMVTFFPLAYAVSRWGNRRADAPVQGPVRKNHSSDHAMILVVHGLLLVLTMLFLVRQSFQRHAQMEIILPELPYLLADWSGRDELLAHHEVLFYGVSGLRKRLYLRGESRVEYVSNTALVSREGLHEPTGCFTSFGWRLLAREEIELAGNGRKVPVVMLQLDRPATGMKQYVIFWFADGLGKYLAGERELTWHVLRRRLLLKPEEVWTLHTAAVSVIADDWAGARKTAEDFALGLVDELETGGNLERFDK
ncbi:MAG TPA: exosortase/archaeosortase family protein [Verrucomicrobiae bacterium]